MIKLSRDAGDMIAHGIGIVAVIDNDEPIRSVAMMILFPDDDLPKSLSRSAVIVSLFPTTDISTFFIENPFWFVR